MTTNPEQEDTVPPLESRRLVIKLRDEVDRLQADLAEVRRQRNAAETDRRIAEQAVSDLLDQCENLRRQRDERPAGRVVRRFVIGTDQRILARVDEPPGTEVAVVVVADDSGTPEPRGIEPNESFTMQARVTSIEHPLPGRREVSDDSGEGE